MSRLCFQWQNFDMRLMVLEKLMMVSFIDIFKIEQIVLQFWKINIRSLPLGNHLFIVFIDERSQGVLPTLLYLHFYYLYIEPLETSKN